jgi:hypothetical protein
METDLSCAGNNERNVGEATGPRGPSERERASQTKQVRVRQGDDPIQSQIRGSNISPTNSDPIRVNLSLKNKKSFVCPPLSQLAPVKIRLPRSTKNYQTNPFVIFQFARKYSGFLLSVRAGVKKRTHFITPQPCEALPVAVTLCRSRIRVHSCNSWKTSLCKLLPRNAKKLIPGYSSLFNRGIRRRHRFCIEPRNTFSEPAQRVRTLTKFTAIKLLIALSLCLCGCAAMHEDEVHSSIPIQYVHIGSRDPNFSIHVVRINLKDPRVSVHVARGGADPDGDGPWLTTLLPTSEIAEREHYAVAINGDFFEAQATKDIEGRDTGYVRGKFAAPVGMAMSGGVLWHQPRTPRPYLEITDAKVAKIETGAASVDAAAREIVGGSNIIVQGGHGILFTNAFATTRHPRTAVGIDATGTLLTLLVVDGRQPDLSVGMTLDELADEMLELSCADAINLDGGGSTTLVYRDEISQQLRVLNSPSDTQERSVAEVLGVTVK